MRICGLNSLAALLNLISSFAETVYHSNSVLSALSSTWTSKPPLAVRYKLDTNALEMESMEGKSHGCTLERLLAWEKKLYEEVKVRVLIDGYLDTDCCYTEKLSTSKR